MYNCPWTHSVMRVNLTRSANSGMTSSCCSGDVSTKPTNHYCARWNWDVYCWSFHRCWHVQNAADNDVIRCCIELLPEQWTSIASNNKYTVCSEYIVWASAKPGRKKLRKLFARQTRVVVVKKSCSYFTLAEDKTCQTSFQLVLTGRRAKIEFHSNVFCKDMSE